MNKIKLLGLAALTAVALLYGQPAFSGDIVNDADQSFSIPGDRKSQTKDIDRKWSRPSVGKRFTTADCGLIYAGKGIVTGFCVSSGTATGYATLVDSNVATGFSASSGTARIHVQSTQPVGVAGAAGVPQGLPCNEFADPLPFTAGLYLCNFDALTNAVVRYRKQE